jgi:hypothetical protein
MANRSSPQELHMSAPATASAALREAIDFACAHETPWTRDPLAEPQRFGIHHGVAVF